MGGDEKTYGRSLISRLPRRATLLQKGSTIATSMHHYASYANSLSWSINLTRIEDDGLERIVPMTMVVKLLRY